MDKSHCGGALREFAHVRRRKQARWAIRQMCVEGKGCVFRRNEARRHDRFARAGDLEMLLLHRQQHETATRSAVAALKTREPRFLKRWRLKNACGDKAAR